MNRARLVFVLVAMSAAMIAQGESPSIQFTRGDVTLVDVAPGTRVAWMGVLFDEADYRERVHVVRGLDVVTPGRSLKVTLAALDQVAGIWTFASVDEDLSATAITPNFNASRRSVEMTAVPGGTSIQFTGARAEVLYVRHGSAWKFSGADGGVKDADATADGRVTMALSALENLQGGRSVPTAVQTGDLILVVDFTKRRTATMTVGR